MGKRFFPQIGDKKSLSSLNRDESGIGINIPCKDENGE